MKNILFILLLASCTTEESIEPTNQEDCNCGEVYKITYIQKPQGVLYEYTLFNNCTGNKEIYQSYVAFNKDDQICLGYKW